MKGTEKKEVKDDSMKDLVSERLRNTKKSIAHYLNEQVNKLSASHKRIALILFGLLMGLICIAQIVQSVNEDRRETTFSIDQITIPNDIHREGERKEELQELLRINQLLDSLKETTVYDSLMIARPGFVDSVHLLIQHFQSKFSN
jgi:hypothetical protein